jgi:plastocyanin
LFDHCLKPIVPGNSMLGAVARLALVLAFLLAGCAEETAGPPEPRAPSPEAAPTTPPPSPAPSSEEECVDATIGGEAEVTIRQLDNVFDPSCLVMLGGQGLELLNRGSNVHNFSVEGTEVALDTPPGQATRTEAIGGVVEPGTYTFFCVYHRSLGMEGELTISTAG